MEGELYQDKRDDLSFANGGKEKGNLQERKKRGFTE